MFLLWCGGLWYNKTKPLQITNHLFTPLDVCYLTGRVYKFAYLYENL